MNALLQKLLLLALLLAAASAHSLLRGSALRSLQDNDVDNEDDGMDDGNDDSADLSDVDILNFALNLECLEAEFYSWAAYGEGLSEELLGGGPASTGGMKANLTEKYQKYAVELAENEIAHVKFLRTALGAAAVQCPAMDIGPAFSAAAEAAVGAPLDPPYSPYYSDSWFLLGAFIFEDVGVTAYEGAAPLIDDSDILSAAARILGTEAYHAGSVRTLLAEIQDETLDPYPLNVTEGVTAVSNLRAAVGGGKDASIVVNGTQTIVPADDDALVYARTVNETLAIVYLGDAMTPGGFFPQGISTTVVAAPYVDNEEDDSNDTAATPTPTQRPPRGDDDSNDNNNNNNNNNNDNDNNDDNNDNDNDRDGRRTRFL